MEDIKTIDLGALRALAKQRSLVMEELFTLVENALLLAYMKQPGAIKGSRAVIDRTTGEFVILAPELDEDNQKIDEFDDTPNNFTVSLPQPSVRCSRSVCVTLRTHPFWASSRTVRAPWCPA